MRLAKNTYSKNKNQKFFELFQIFHKIKYFKVEFKL